MPAETCGEDVLPQGTVVAGVGVGAPEFVAHLGVEAFAAPDFEPAADREGEAVEGTGIVVDGEVVFEVTECPACLAAQEDVDVIGDAEVEGVAAGERSQENILVVVTGAPLRGYLDAKFVAYAGIPRAVEVLSQAETDGIGGVGSANGIEPLQSDGGLPVLIGQRARFRGGQVIGSGRCAATQQAK